MLFLKKQFNSCITYICDSFHLEQQCNGFCIDSNHTYNMDSVVEYQRKIPFIIIDRCDGWVAAWLRAPLPKQNPKNAITIDHSETHTVTKIDLEKTQVHTEIKKNDKYNNSNKWFFFKNTHFNYFNTYSQLTISFCIL